MDDTHIFGNTAWQFFSPRSQGRDVSLLIKRKRGVPAACWDEKLPYSILKRVGKNPEANRRMLSAATLFHCQFQKQPPVSARQGLTTSVQYRNMFIVVAYNPFRDLGRRAGSGWECSRFVTAHKYTVPPAHEKPVFIESMQQETLAQLSEDSFAPHNQFLSDFFFLVLRNLSMISCDFFQQYNHRLGRVEAEEGVAATLWAPGWFN